MNEELNKVLANSERKAHNWDYPKYKMPELKTEIDKDLPEGKIQMVNESKAKRAREKLGAKATEKQILEEYVKLGGLIVYPDRKKKKYWNKIGFDPK